MRKKCITPLIWDKKTCGLALPKVPIIMKSLFYACLLSSAGLTYASNSYAQTTMVSINVENQTVKEVLDEIENTTEYSFFYNTRHVDLDRKVSVNINNADIFEVLDDVFSGTNVVYSVKDRSIILSVKEASPLIAQKERRITGTVVDASGIPVIGANVMVKGTSNGTITDMDGKFTLEVSDGAVLEVSYIGYLSQTVKVSGKTISVTLLEDTQKLDEVVVVAYGTTKKSAITGSVSVIDKEKISKNQSTNITQSLQGLVAGVQVVTNSGQPGADQTVMIRGLGSMTASSNPLYVVDGIPFDLSLNSIPATDIESISVLKDAAAASLYGAHAANGVVLITTKNGKGDKPKVEFHATLGTSELATPFPEKVSAAKQWENVWQGLYNDATDFLGKTDEEARQYATEKVPQMFYNPMPFITSDGTQRLYHSGWNMDYPVGLDGKIKPDAKRLWDFDIYDEFFKHRLKQDYGINISGAFNDRNRYYASFSYLNDKGAYVGDNYKRYSGNLKLDTKIFKWLDMSNSILYTNTVNKNSPFDIRPMRVFSRENTIYIYDYQNNCFKERPMNPGQLALDNARETGRRQYSPDMMWLYKDKGETVDNLKTTTTLTASFLDMLTFRTVYSYQLYNSLWYENTPPDNGALLDEPEWGSIGRSTTRATTHYFNNVLTFDKTFRDLHHLNAFVGQEAYMYSNRSFYANRSGLLLPFFQELGQATQYPSVGSGTAKYNLFSYFAKVQYDFDNKYHVTGSFRTDGSSRFASSGRWGKFFSFGAAWVLSRESFMESTSDWLNNLKLKASYGELGNDNIGSYYGYQGFYGVGGNYYGNLSMTPTQIPNPDLKWETNINTNAGIEFTLFNRLSGNFEVFKRKSKDLLMATPIPTSTGWETQLKNIGSMENLGVELELNYDIIKTNKLLWSINGNLSHFRNKITSVPFDMKESQTDINGESGIAYYRWYEGGSRYDMYLPEWAGVNPENGRAQWWKTIYDDNGNAIERVKTEDYSEVDNTEQRVKIGSSLPKIYGSFGTSLQYAGFDLSMMFYYSLGGLVYDYNYSESAVLRECWATYDWLDQSWKKPGDITDFPKMYMEYSSQAYSGAKISSRWVEKNNFLRLKNLVIGYTLPKSIVSKIGLSNARIQFRGENLFTTGKLHARGTDPEAGGMWGQNKSGLTYFNTRSYNIGVNLTF